MRLSLLIIDFLHYLKAEKEASQKTLENYDHYLNKFLKFAGDLEPEKVDLDLIQKYRRYLNKWSDPKTKKGLKKVTQNYFLIALRTFLRYLDKRGIPTISTESVILDEAETPQKKVLDEAAVERLMKTPNVLSRDGLRDKALLEILFSTGLLVSEVASLNRDIINLDQGSFTVIGKGKRVRTVLLSPAAIKWLDQYIKNRKDPFQPLFIRYQGSVETENNGEKMRLTSRSIQRIVEKYVKLAGLTIKATPQTLRHSFATERLKEGEDIKSVQELLGHQNLSTTQVYTHLLDS